MFAFVVCCRESCKVGAHVRRRNSVHHRKDVRKRGTGGQSTTASPTRPAVRFVLSGCHQRTCRSTPHTTGHRRSNSVPDTNKKQAIGSVKKNCKRTCVSRVFGGTENGLRILSSRLEGSCSSLLKLVALTPQFHTHLLGQFVAIIIISISLQFRRRYDRAHRRTRRKKLLQVQIGYAP